VPTYEYRCRDCGQHLEVVQSFTDDPLTSCGVCNGSLRKVFSSIGVTFKGSGFYRTDSRSGSAGSKKAEPSESTSSGDSGGSGSPSTPETKSEKRSEGKSEGKTEAKSA
jgi:putative FmdB family regulatory protein